MPAYREPRQPVRVPFLSLLSRLAGKDASAAGTIYRRNLPQRIMVTLVWIGLATALARPQWVDEPIVKELPMRDLLVARGYGHQVGSHMAVSVEGRIAVNMEGK